MLGLVLSLASFAPSSALAQACGSVGGSTVNLSTCTGPATLNGTVDDVTVNAGATISGGASGIDQNGDALSSLTVNSGSTVSGTHGVLVNQTISSFINHGAITSTGGTGITINTGGSITTLSNSSTGTITGTGSTGVNISTGTTLGTLTNSGTITGTTAGAGTGIMISGTLTTLTNNAAGTIGLSGGRTGIHVSDGTLSNFSNAGRIQGGVSEAILISSAGSLLSMTNSGTIAGDIINNSSNTLTINGGSGSTYGILTGTSGNTGSGDRGTISNNNNNLLFNSGNIFLNNNVNLGGNSLINSGATVRLDNTITITGIYQQTSGGLLITTTSNGSVYGKLTVTGNATVTGSTITINGSGMSAGQTFTIVDTSAIGTYSGNTVTITGTSGLGGTLSIVSNDLVVTLYTITSGGGSSTGSNWTSKGNAAGGTAGQIGGTLDTISNSSSPTSTAFKNDVLNALDNVPTAAQGRAMKQLAPTQIVPVAQMGRNAMTTVSTAIGRHQQLSMEHVERTGLSTGSEEQRSALWGEALGGGAQQNGNGKVDGYKLVDYGLVFGMDYRVGADTLAGAALSWMHADADGEDNTAGSSSELDSYQLTLYGSQRYGNLVFDGQLGAGWNQYDQRRRVDFLGRTAGADYDGQQYLARILVGYDIPVGNSTTVTPQAGVRLLHARYDGYTETGAGTANLAVDRADANSVTHDIGAKLAWTTTTGLGQLKPEVSAAWLHDYIDSPATNSGVMGGQAFTVKVPRTSSDGARLGLAATLADSSRLSLRATMESEFRPDYQSHTGMVRGIWAF